jgi:hypothetical protein
MSGRTRFLPVLAAFVCLAIAVAPAMATDNGPGSAPAPTSPAPAAPGTLPAAPDTTPPAPAGCSDKTRPTTHLVSSSKTARKKHKLSGTARDAGCTTSAVAQVSVSVARKKGKKCQFMSRTSRLGHAKSCKSPRWISAKGTKTWSLKLPKRMPKGSYTILTRAVDSAGNVERAHTRRLAVR